MGFDRSHVLETGKVADIFSCHLCHGLVTLDAVVTPECSHVFCPGCLDGWVQQSVAESRRWSGDAGLRQEEQQQPASCGCPVCHMSLAISKSSGRTKSPSQQSPEKNNYLVKGLRALAVAQPVAFSVLRVLQVACVHFCVPVQQGPNSSNPKSRCDWCGDYGMLEQHTRTKHGEHRSNNVTAYQGGSHAPKKMVRVGPLPVSASSNHDKRRPSMAGHRSYSLSAIHAGSSDAFPVARRRKREGGAAASGTTSLQSETEPSAQAQNRSSSTERARPSKPEGRKAFALSRSMSELHMHTGAPAQLAKGGGSNNAEDPISLANLQSPNRPRSKVSLDMLGSPKGSSLRPMLFNGLHDVVQPLFVKNSDKISIGDTTNSSNVTGPQTPVSVGQVKNSASTLMNKTPFIDTRSIMASNDPSFPSPDASKKNTSDDGSNSELEVSYSHALDWNVSINSIGGWNNSFSHDNRAPMDTVPESLGEEEQSFTLELEPDEDSNSSTQLTPDERTEQVLAVAEKLRKQANAKFNKADFAASRQIYTEALTLMSSIRPR
jgi:hypothetical protein